jgi:hypothetical protein
LEKTKISKKSDYHHERGQKFSQKTLKDKKIKKQIKE